MSPCVDMETGLTCISDIFSSVIALDVKCHFFNLGSGVASPTIWSCYGNISVLINRENNQFLKK
jgi:hypothetical protein